MESNQAVNLQESTTGTDLYQSHKLVLAYHQDFYNEMELYYDNLSGKMWTSDEQLLFKRKKKSPVVINDLKPAERTILGLFIQNKYDVKFSPRDDAQDLSDVLQKLYAWTAYSQDWAFKDIETVRQAWCGGVGYQEIYMKIIPGQEPVMITNNINPFTIAWDPESKDLITRDDAQFYDRDTWVTFDDLRDMFPDKVTDEESLQNSGAQGFQNYKTYADRTAEWYDTKNNRYKVTERYYRVSNRSWHTMDGKEKREISNPEERNKYREEGYQIHAESAEMLHLAIICPAWRNGEYLYNGEYHCQPRHLFTKRIIFPLVELVAESINGVPSGFVKHLIQINRLKNSAVSNMFHAQKHAASTALIRKRKLFGSDEAMAKQFDASHSDADRVFQASDQADLGADVAAVPKGIVSQDSHHVLGIADTAFGSISSSPPSLQGQAENASTSGVLNSQRIEQSVIQLQVFTSNIKHFFKRRAELVYYYWREYYTYPMKVRIIGGDPKPFGADMAQGQGQPMQGAQQQHQTHVEINKENPVLDWRGQPTGAIEKINDVNSARYDIDIEDSFRSPTYRAKIQQQLSDAMQRPNIDPQLMDILAGAWAESTDMAQQTKDLIKKHYQDKIAASQQPPPPPPPEPLRVSMSIKPEDLNSENTIIMLQATNAIPKEAADAMRQSMQQQPQGPAPVDLYAANEHQNKQAELSIKSQELQQKTEFDQASIQLKTQELELKKAELDLKHLDSQNTHALAINAVNKDAQGEPNPELTIAQMRAETEIEKAHIASATQIQTAKLGHAAQAEQAAIAMATGNKLSPVQSGNDGQMIGDVVKELNAKIDQQSKYFEAEIKMITDSIMKPKNISVSRGIDGKISGVTVAHQISKG